MLLAELLSAVQLLANRTEIIQQRSETIQQQFAEYKTIKQHFVNRTETVQQRTETILQQLANRTDSIMKQLAEHKTIYMYQQQELVARDLKDALKRLSRYFSHVGPFKYYITRLGGWVGVVICNFLSHGWVGTLVVLLYNKLNLEDG